MTSADCHPDVPGQPLSTENHVLTTGAAATQNFAPLKNVCAHLNAFHVYADEPSRKVETNHYCAHLNDEVRQCLLYDSPNADARLIGIEYMITPNLYETLSESERRLWHSHVYEVKSGMLIMPNTNPIMPSAAWEAAETREMEQVVTLYGKVFHLWQTDRGDKLPLGEPRLMTSFTQDGQMEDWDEAVGDRDRRFGEDWRRKKELRKDIQEMEAHPDADQTWKKSH
ncbi:oil body-associated protein 1A [Sarocladium implicatum]|nr:oil body-associated protein 1A [Sarocladium implicatum]